MNVNFPVSKTYKPRLGKTVVFWLKDIYDLLGLICIFSMFCSFLLLALFWLDKLIASYSLLVLIQILALWLASPIPLGLIVFAHKHVYSQNPSFGDIFTGYSLYRSRALGTGLLNLTMIWLIYAGFSLTLLQIKTSLAWAVSAAFLFYGLLFLLGSLIYQGPVLVFQNTGVFSSFRKSCLMVLDNPLFTVGAIFVIILFTVLCVIPAFAGFFLLYAGALPLFCVRAAKELFIKYGLAEPDREPEPEEHNWKFNS